MEKLDSFQSDFVSNESHSQIVHSLQSQVDYFRHQNQSIEKEREMLFKTLENQTPNAAVDYKKLHEELQADHALLKNEFKTELKDNRIKLEQSHDQLHHAMLQMNQSKSQCEFLQGIQKLIVERYKMLESNCEVLRQQFSSSTAHEQQLQQSLTGLEASLSNVTSDFLN